MTRTRSTTGRTHRLGKTFMLRRFREQEDGSLTVEMAIWAPFLLCMLALIMDFAYLMVVNANMWSAARDTARAVSIHRVRPEEANDYLRSRLFFGNNDYVVDVQVDRDEVDARISLPGAKASLTPVMGRYVVGELKASISMLREPS